MCGICCILPLKLSVEDQDVLTSLKKYNETFEEVLEESDLNSLCNNDCKNNKYEENDQNKINSFLKSPVQQIINSIKNRGPDFFDCLAVKLYNINDLEENEQIIKLKQLNISNFLLDDLYQYLIEQKEMLLISSVLSLRGIYEPTTKQPLINYDTGSLLQYNGEIFSINNMNKNNKDFDNEFNLYKENDGLILFEYLNKISFSGDESAYVESLYKLLNNIESDHAFIFHDIKNNRIIINRDIFGKRSLLLVYDKTYGYLYLLSVLPEFLYKNKANLLILEIPNNCLLILDLNKESKLKVFFNKEISKPSLLRFSSKQDILNIYQSENLLVSLESQCLDLLKKSVYKRTCNLPDIVKNPHLNNSEKSISVLFSGGIDSLLLAYLVCVSVPKDFK